MGGGEEDAKEVDGCVCSTDRHIMPDFSTVRNKHMSTCVDASAGARRHLLLTLRCRVSSGVKALAS